MSIMAYTSLMMIAVIFIVFLGSSVMFMRFYVKAGEGKAIIRSGLGGTVVRFSATIAIPSFHSVEILDLSTKQVIVERRSKNAVVCRNNVAVDMKIVFFMRINPTEEDILLAARSLGCEHASDADTISRFFESILSESIETAARRYDASDLANSRDEFKMEIGSMVEKDIAGAGFLIDEIAVNFFPGTNVNNDHKHDEVMDLPKND